MPEPIDMAAVEKAVIALVRGCALATDIPVRVLNSSHEIVEADEALCTLIRSIIAERDRLKAENERLQGCKHEQWAWRNDGRQIYSDKVCLSCNAVLMFGKDSPSDLASAPEPSTGSKEQ